MDYLLNDAKQQLYSAGVQLAIVFTLAIFIAMTAALIVYAKIIK